MENITSYKEIIDHEILQSPINAAFDAFENDKTGFCVILYKPSLSIDINETRIQKVYKFDKFPHAYLSHFILEFLVSQPYKMIIFEYINTNCCSEDGKERQVMVDVTNERIKIAKSFQQIFEILD